MVKAFCPGDCHDPHIHDSHGPGLRSRSQVDESSEDAGRIERERIEERYASGIA
jgi:hypothetical protein